MCDPTLIIGALTQAVSYQAQVEAAEAQADYQNKVAEARNQEIMANYRAANQAAITSYTQLNQRLEEAQASHSQEIEELEIEKKNALGELAATNLNTGMSLEALKLDYGRQADRYEGVQEASLKSLGLQTRADKKEAYAQAESRSNAIQAYIPQPVQSPSPLSLAAGLGGAVLGSLNKPTAPAFKNTAPKGGIYDSATLKNAKWR